MSQREVERIIREFERSNRRPWSEESTRWLATNLSKIQSEIRSENYNRKKAWVFAPGNLLSGSMLFFGYDPKTKNDLNFWDSFPLIILLKKTGRSLLGLNLHYLSPMLRARLMNSFLKFVDDPNYYENPNATFKLTYSLLKQTQSLAAFRACIKRYKLANIVTPVNLIPANEWKYTVFMPLDKFRGASRQEVWAWANRYK